MVGAVKVKRSIYFATLQGYIISSPEPLGSQGELIGWP